MKIETDEVYHQQIEKWREAREASLRSPEGWLSLVGLYMLADGDYKLGSGSDNDIVLPSSAPLVLGMLNFQQGRATLHVQTDAPLLVNDAPPIGGGDVVELTDNSKGNPTVVKVGSVRFNVHKFGEEFALRVRDSEATAIQEFPGCKWYEIKSEYRVRGHLVREHVPTPIAVATSVKTVADYQNIGSVHFELAGRPLRLLASAASKPTELLIIFRDMTAGRTTYGAGRYLYAEIDEADGVMLDFNKAYNPPCTFTPYATCSLPPAENILGVAIEAGELYITQ